MHKRLPKELVFFTATLMCHTGSLKEEARGLQCHNLAGISPEGNLPIHMECVGEKMQQQWREPWSEDW